MGAGCASTISNTFSPTNERTDTLMHPQRRPVIMIVDAIARTAGAL